MGRYKLIVKEYIVKLRINWRWNDKIIINCVQWWMLYQVIKYNKALVWMKMKVEYMCSIIQLYMLIYIDKWWYLMNVGVNYKWWTQIIRIMIYLVMQYMILFCNYNEILINDIDVSVCIQGWRKWTMRYILYINLIWWITALIILMVISICYPI